MTLPLLFFDFAFSTSLGEAALQVASLKRIAASGTKDGASTMTTPWSCCLVAVGANLSDPLSRVEAAIEAIGQLPTTSLETRSQLYCTQPVGGPAGQQEFLNGALALRTQLSPSALLRELQTIETDLGRTRQQRWAARTIDLDLLLYGDQVLATSELTIPHPRMSFRPFVMEPAVEVASDWSHPQLGVTLAELWQQLQAGSDQILLTGGSEADRRWLAEQLASQLAHLPLEIAPVDSLTGNSLTGNVLKNSMLLAVGVLASELKGRGPPILPKLTLALGGTLVGGAREGAADRLPSGPTLSLASVVEKNLPARREAWLFEAAAAIEAIWPERAKRSGLGVERFRR